MAGAGLLSYTADGSVPEDLIDLLENVDPVETPFTSMTDNGTASDTLHIWMTDVYAAATENAALEGITIAATQLGMPTRENNTTQIMRKEFDVSDTQEAIEHRGMSGAISYQMMKAMAELARDTEYSLLRETQATGASDSARAMSGLATLIAADLNLSGISVNGAITLLEADFNSCCQDIWENGVRPNTCLTPSNAKRGFSSFVTALTRNIDAVLKKQVLSVMQYDGDFGVVDIILERYTPISDIVTEWAIPVFERSKCRKDWLIPTRSEMQARRGDATPGFVMHEVTLVVTNGRSAGLITGHSTTTASF